jgi:NAD(P)-dependent dehydrogenase (short-subunit alcohol dehydrogenase family)
LGEQIVNCDSVSTNLFSLQCKTFLITGGTRGIGRAISMQFARSGARVIASYLRNEKAAEQLKSAAEADGLEILLCRADLSTPRGLEQLNACLEVQGLRLDGLVHCAATGVHRALEELTERHFDWVMNLNSRAFFNLVKLLLARFNAGSAIVAVSSWGALRALPYYTLVGTSKGALEALARHLAAELAPRGIRVNILVPGTVRTDVWDALPDSEGRLAEAARRTPAGRLVTVEEVACGAHYLCSAAARGVVGQTLVIDVGAGIVA